MKGDEVIKTGEESSDCLLFSHIWYVNRIWLNVLVIDLRNGRSICDPIKAGLIDEQP